MDKELLETLNLIADHLAVISQRLAAIEEDQRLDWALTRQIWLNPAPGYTRVRVKWNENGKKGEEPVLFAGNVVRSERLPAPHKAPTGGVSIPTLERMP